MQKTSIGRGHWWGLIKPHSLFISLINFYLTETHGTTSFLNNWWLSQKLDIGDTDIEYERGIQLGSSDMRMMKN